MLLNLSSVLLHLKAPRALSIWCSHLMTTTVLLCKTRSGIWNELFWEAEYGLKDSKHQDKVFLFFLVSTLRSVQCPLSHSGSIIILNKSNTQQPASFKDWIYPTSEQKRAQLDQFHKVILNSFTSVWKKKCNKASKVATKLLWLLVISAKTEFHFWA